jgi:hypothetical protein
VRPGDGEAATPAEGGAIVCETIVVTALVVALLAAICGELLRVYPGEG